MIRKLFNFKTVALITFVAFAVGLSAGGSVVYKWAQAQEAARLKVALELADQEKVAALDSLKVYYENRPPVIKEKVKYVIKTLKYDPRCNVGDDERRLLNDARTGLFASARGADEGDREPGAAAAVGEISRGAEVLAHIDAATRYRECYAVAKAVHQYLVDRAD